MLHHLFPLVAKTEFMIGYMVLHYYIFLIQPAGLPKLCLKKVSKLPEVLNIRITAGHRSAKTQEKTVRWGHFSRSCLKSQKFCLQNRVKIHKFKGACWWFCDGICKKELVLGIHKKVAKKSAV